MKRLHASLICLFILAMQTLPVFADDSAITGSAFKFSDSQIRLIEASKTDPVKIGIIPNIYPMSVCPPENGKFEGIILDTLDLLSQKTGLELEFVRIPIEKMTPIDFLKTKEVEAVAGTLIYTNNINDKSILLSEKLFDASVTFVAKKDLDLSTIREKKLTIGILNGFAPGEYYAKKYFPSCDVLKYKNPTECLQALKKGDIDFSLINKYVANYQLEKPTFSDITIVNPQSIPLSSCIATLATDSDLMEVINSGLKAITEEEHCQILMQFTISNPYQLTMEESLHKYGWLLVFFASLLGFLLFVLSETISMKQLIRSFSYDRLTGLYSKNGFEIKCEEMIRRNNNNSKLFLIAYDIKNFKNYNALYGVESGDLLLKNIASRINFNLSKTEIKARINADCFIALTGADDINQIILKIQELDNIAASHMGDISIRINYGIYCIEDTKTSIKDMIHMAQMANRNSKKKNEMFYTVYNSAIMENRIESRNILFSIDEALRNEEFFINIQPKYDIFSEQVVGGEALVRWRKPDGSVIMPGRFIKIFEQSGAIVKLDFYVLDKACALQRFLLDQGIKPHGISVNFSNLNLQNPNFVADLYGIVKKYDLSSDLIEVEFTESVMVNDKLMALKVVDELHSHGFKIALDDFGSGYSSLIFFNDLPVDVVKLDKGFVEYNFSQKDTSKGNEVVRCFTSLLSKLGIQCVAEGIETFEQLSFLRECGNCEIIQGYYFSKPLDVESYVNLIKPGNISKEQQL